LKTLLYKLDHIAECWLGSFDKPLLRPIARSVTILFEK
jgi:hypothetical protein